jgi:taurine dioxygenase
MRGVLDKFSPDMRALLKSKQAVHESYHVFKGEYGAAHRTEGGANAAAVEAPVFPESVHPVVLQHPETGVESLYVNRSFTTKIVDVPAIESKHLLDMAYYVTSNANECEFYLRALDRT